MRRAMATGRPLLVDPRELARRGAVWVGRVPAASFARMARVSGRGATAVEVRLNFGLDDEGRCRVRGSARTRVRVSCQRCVRSVERVVATDIDLVVLDSEADARALTPRYDTCVLVDRKISIDALIEDDLLLSLPEHGCERRDECPYAPAVEYPTSGVADGTRSSPFAVLAGVASARPEDERDR